MSLVRTVTTALVVSISLPAYAGPDFRIIEKGRSARQAEIQHSPGLNPKDAAGCPPDKLVLPLDHGPRARTTPYLNERRRQRYEEQMRECEGAQTPVESGAASSTHAITTT